MMQLDWDPEVDSPATIGIIGGGPVGIEAAIYARFLGYFVSIFEERRVAHRMLDWHTRPLAVPMSQCTTSLGHAAILAQNPDYQRCPADQIGTGQSYANDYLIPLAKTDLLFDDIHFLSPVQDVSRLATFSTDQVLPQERANDEFRILVHGRHRGPWIARADIVIDCRGVHQQMAGMGPGGGLAIGELDLRDTFYKHSPRDRKFELRALKDRRICLVGRTWRAAQFANEFMEIFGNATDTRLTWVLPLQPPEIIAPIVEHIRQAEPPNISLQTALGVEQIERSQDSMYALKLLQDDDSLISIECDVVCQATDGRSAPLSRECNETELGADYPRFLTMEPGFYRLRAGSVEQGAGVGLAQAFDAIRSLFALIAGRSDLDLYSIMEKQQAR
jgi:hypothetical protein